MKNKLKQSIDPILFEEACHFVIDNEKILKGIGTLSEKTVHAVLKYYYAPKEIYHEHKIGSYVADILVDGEIMEIQTRNFNTLRRKLDFFLPEYEVTIIYPVAHTKWLRWIDEETGEITDKRKSPKAGSHYAIIPELYRIKNYLKDPHIHFTISLIDVVESRLLNGWSKDKKKGSTRDDGIPIGIYDEIHINNSNDYIKLLPDSLPELFTSKDYKRCAKISQHNAVIGLNLLYYMNIVDRVSKDGNAFIYKKQQTVI